MPYGVITLRLLSNRNSGPMIWGLVATQKRKHGRVHHKFASSRKNKSLKWVLANGQIMK